MIADELPSRAVIAAIALALAVAGWPPRMDWFAEYRDLDAIDAHLGELAAARPELATASTLGTWGEADSSDDPRASTYRGERPFSEPETQAMRALFQRERADWISGSASRRPAE